MQFQMTSCEDKWKHRRGKRHIDSWIQYNLMKTCHQDSSRVFMWCLCLCLSATHRDEQFRWARSLVHVRIMQSYWPEQVKDGVNRVQWWLNICSESVKVCFATFYCLLEGTWSAESDFLQQRKLWWNSRVRSYRRDTRYEFDAPGSKNMLKKKP